MSDLPTAPPLPKRATPEIDALAAGRKADHIELAFASKTGAQALDTRFYYEPALAAHPRAGSLPRTSLGPHTLRAPLWVSSMTGGTARARHINTQLARVCAEFGMGMGLGSCRALLHDDSRLPDFDMRPHIGPDLPLYANLGIAQVEHLVADDEIARIDELCDLLRADGLIVHVNPFQEWLHPEGDRLEVAPIDTIEALLARTRRPIIVKEVGQGFGPGSLRRLLALPLLAVEFAAAGGTNFSRLENLRSDATRQARFAGLELIGHTAPEMVDFVNAAAADLGGALRCRNVIISGGVTDFLDGYYLMGRCRLNSVYGQASAFLQHAMGDYAALRDFVETQVRGLEVARAYLKVRD